MRRFNAVKKLNLFSYDAAKNYWNPSQDGSYMPIYRDEQTFDPAQGDVFLLEA